MSTIAVNTITDASGGTTAKINGYTPTVSNMAGRNRIINGAQVINQRNATVTTASTFVTDRWQVDNITTSGAVSFAQSSTAPAGFTNSLKITVTTADAAVAATDLIDFRQWIEGYNFADLGFGSVSASSFTFSFWVRSSLVGTYGVSFRNSASDRVYVATYTINSADTWEQKTITVAGDTSGTWLTDNGRGLGVAFTVMCGSNFQGTAGSWGTTNNRTTSAQANLLATNGATFYITGVQLEKGSVATPFEYRQYGTELQLCQRYGQMAANATEAGHIGFLNGVQAIYWMSYYCPVVFRSSPSATITGTLYPTNYASNLSTITGVSSIASFGSVVRIVFSLNSTPAKEACGLNANSGSVFLSAEL